ncbi:hypothetical protein F4561_005946 [Lipingzhangella halophila]|uniref:DUF7144 domain-containing protein n=1 Tax=Lipingzhangella halophila TaxID=1783352 RepID=A0A7W7W599_9ACTN|nr:hypothetical protein [Lipingzhangella halophila]MBB4935052.1 hypothetical protein [Lipingzhangella halophila]
MNNRLHGWGAFAATMMLLAGAFLLIQGIAAMATPVFFVGAEADLMMATFMAWGVVLGILGVLKLLSGIALFTGRMWARTAGVVLAGISAVVQLGFLSAFPIWSLAIIAVNVVVIYGLTAGWSMAPAGGVPEEEAAYASSSYQAGRSDATRAPTQRGGAHERPERAGGGATSGSSG